MSTEYCEHMRIKGVFIYQVSELNKVGVLTGYKTLQFISFHSADDLYELRMALVIESLVYPLMRGVSKVYIWDIDKLLYQCPFSSIEQPVFYVIKLPKLMSSHQKSRLYRLISTSCLTIGDFVYLRRHDIDQIMAGKVQYLHITEEEKKRLLMPTSEVRKSTIKMNRGFMHLIDRCNPQHYSDTSCDKNMQRFYVSGPYENDIFVRTTEKSWKMSSTLYLGLKRAFRRLISRRELLEKLGIPQEMNANLRDSINDAYYMAAEIFDDAIENECVTLLTLNLDLTEEEQKRLLGPIISYRLMDNQCNQFGSLFGLNHTQVMETYKNLNQEHLILEDCDRVPLKLRSTVPQFDPKFSYQRIPFHSPDIMKNYKSL